MYFAKTKVPNEWNAMIILLFMGTFDTIAATRSAYDSSVILL